MTDKAPRLLIAYDLINPNSSETTRNALHAALESLGAKPIQKTVWLLRSNEDPRSICVNLQKFISAEDRLLVTHTMEFTSHKGITELHLI